ncbi:MAG TPA: DUF1015 family protein [Nocardioides sp.]
MSARAFARPYRDVASRLGQWERRGHLVRDEAPAVYLHEYTSGGLTVRGLVGALDLTRRAAGLEDRAVWPHEGVHPTQVQELAARMDEMEINPAPILLVHRGPADVRALLARVAEGEPVHQLTDRAGQRQRIWAIREPGALEHLSRALAQSRPLLADGHHRYAAYLALQRRHPGTAWDRGLAMIVDQEDTPLFLGAIHRVVPRCALDDLLDAARAVGTEPRELPRAAALDALSPERLVLTDQERWASVPVPAGLLAVDFFHEQLLTRACVTPEVTYHHAADLALEQASRDDVTALMPALAFDDVERVLARGSLLPEKATSFQPKPSLGAIMRSLRDERHEL